MLQRLSPGVILLLLGSLLPEAHGEAHLIVFKDGFSLTGRLKEAKSWIVDGPSGQAFKIPTPGALLTLEDDARSMVFSPVQVQDGVKADDRSRELVKFTLAAPLGNNPLSALWSLDSTGPWDPRWERAVRIIELVKTGTKPLDLTQRLTELGPQAYRIDVRSFNWVERGLTAELGPEVVRKLLLDWFEMQRKKPSSVERRVKMSRFFLQAGWLEMAEKELEGIEGNSDTVDPLREQIKVLRHREFISELEAALKLGRYEELQDRLKLYSDRKMAKEVNEAQQLVVQEVKNKLAAARERLEAVQRHLKELPDLTTPQYRIFFKQASAALAGEVTVDSLDRLETFLDQARSYELARQQKRQPSQSPDQILSFAISGWLLGNGAAEDDLGNARQLWRARRLILDCQKASDDVARRRLLAGVQSNELPAVDVLARLIRHLPPPEPHANLDTDVQQLQVQLPDTAAGGNYHVKLPPEYHHGRSYPVLILLHQAGEKPQKMLQRWSELAAKEGFILAAPSWSANEPYKFSASDRAAVLDCLRHLRRCFQVDSDRVFLFGAGTGGQAAFDIGFSHPDQFAGILPMSAIPTGISARYAANPQYLPQYVVDGQRHNKNTKVHEQFFGNWIRWRYPVLLVEYRGRGADLFTAEFPRMMDWMRRKKRFHPIRDLEEFRTMRRADNRFYFLSTSSILDRCLSEGRWEPTRKEATLQANIYAGNQIHVRTSGVKQVSVWLTPGMIDFSKKVLLRVNGAEFPGRTVQHSLDVLLEDFALNGDRQRLFLARLDTNL